MTLLVEYRGLFGLTDINDSDLLGDTRNTTQEFLIGLELPITGVTTQ